MLYWSRTGSIFDLLAWLLLSGLSFLGGWLLCVHQFNLRSRERLFAGITLGTMLLMFTSNLLAQIISLRAAFWASAMVILGLGFLAAWRSSQRPRFPLGDFWVWSQWLAFLGIFLFFILVNRGLAIFDDFVNLPMVAALATGDVPPHFYLNPEKMLDHHYGMHLLAAGLVEIGGFFPFSALDVYKAFSMALGLILPWLWYRRFIGDGRSWFWLGLFILFAGGTRWMLLLLPQPQLELISAGVQMLGSAAQTAPDLASALLKGWEIAGDGPLPFPFAFMNGITTPLPLAMSSKGGWPTLALLLLLASRSWRPVQGLLFGVLVASTALVSETVFVMAWGGVVAGVAVEIIRRWYLHRSWDGLLGWLWVLLPGAILAPLMGGALTVTLQNILLSARGEEVTAIMVPPVGLRWPPALLSGHLGALSIADPGQLLIALLEIGPLLLLGPWVILALPGYFRSRKLFAGGLVILSIVSFLAPILIRFVDRDRDIARLTAETLKVWMLLGLPYLWLAYKRSGKLVRSAIGTAYVLSILGGVALLPTLLVAMARPQVSSFIGQPDVILSRTYWDQLEEDAWVLDPQYPYRPIVLFGRSTGPAFETIYYRLPEFKALLDSPDPVAMARAGYDYVYLDRETWQKFTGDQRRAFQQPCVRLRAQQKAETGDFRRLLDIRNCGKSVTGSISESHPLLGAEQDYNSTTEFWSGLFGRIFLRL
jgi:hypothetical protein